MKKTGLLLCALLLMAAVLTGCVRTRETGTLYEVYFLSAAGEESALGAELRMVPEGEEPVRALLHALLEGPTDETLTPAIPNGVRLRTWDLEDGLLTVDFSGKYNSLSGIDLTLADYSIVATLSQVEGVDEVKITADGVGVPYRDHQRLAPDDIQPLDLPEPEDEA